MKLITWNIQWARGLDGRVDPARIVAHARSLADFDVLCLQEIADNFPALAGNDDRDHFAELARLLPGYRMAEVIAVDVAGEDGRRRRFGNAIFTRYSLLAIRSLSLPQPLQQRRDVHLVGLVVAGERVHHDVDAGAESKLALPRLTRHERQHRLAIAARRPGAGKIV